jgi:hypothetical protein
MSDSDIASTRCAFIPIYCYYDRQGAGEVKTPILLMDQDTFLLKAILLDIDHSIFTTDELKDQFIEAYNESACSTQDKANSLDSYDIYPQLVSVLHTDEEEISIYVCELYDNTERYFKKINRNSLAEPITYKKGIDELIMGGALDSLTEKILVSLTEEDYITHNKDSDSNSNSVELF